VLCLRIINRAARLRLNPFRADLHCSAVYTYTIDFFSFLVAAVSAVVICFVDTLFVSYTLSVRLNAKRSACEHKLMHCLPGCDLKQQYRSSLAAVVQ
jgi:hypothetical protein